jgi:hypothetical protein
MSLQVNISMVTNVINGNILCKLKGNLAKISHALDNGGRDRNSNTINIRAELSSNPIHLSQNNRVK